MFRRGEYFTYGDGGCALTNRRLDTILAMLRYRRPDLDPNVATEWILTSHYDWHQFWIERANPQDVAEWAALSCPLQLPPEETDQD